MQVHMIPPQRPRLLGPDPGHQQQHHVGMQAVRPGISTASATASGSVDERPRLVESQRLGRSPVLPSRRPDQGGHIPAHQVVCLGMTDRPHQAVVRDLHGPCRQVTAESCQGRPDVSGRQFPQRGSPQPLHQRLDSVPVQLDRPRRPARQPVLEPRIHRRLDRVSRRGLHASVQLRVECLELVPDLLLGLAGDLPAHALSASAEADRDRADVPVLVCREVNGIFAMPAAPN